MLKKLLLGFILTITCHISFSQTAVDSLMKVGDKYYKKKDFITAAQTWENAAQLTENKLAKNTHYYYASHAYAKAKDSTNSFKCLDIAITQLGFNDLPALKNDDSYLFMNQSGKWKKLLSSIKTIYTTNPKAVKLIDKDVTNFWQAYDLVQKNPDMAEKIYMEHYINKGTMALQFYYLNKISSVKKFVNTHNLKKKYYPSIRANTLKTSQLKPVFQQSFVNLKNMYPDAIFPPVYFVIGKLNSGGTTSSDGLILAIDQASMSPTADTTELNNWEKQNISPFKNLPYTVAHELIHFQQNGMASDTTLLAAALKEGMADFIGELISGKSANERLKIFAKGKEKSIWKDFEKEMFLNRGYNWIANSDQETADKPADLGYWVGYQICKAYYAQSKDKKKAVYEMLHIQDYKKFFKQSKFGENYK